MSLLLERIRARRPTGYSVCNQRRTAREVPLAVQQARATAKAYEATKRRRLKAARFRTKSIKHRPLSAVTSRPKGLPSFRLGLLLANAKDYDGFSIDTGMRRDDEHAMLLFRQAADTGHVGAQVALGEFYQAGRGRKRGGIPPCIPGVKAETEKDKMDAPHVHNAAREFRRAAKAGDPHACLRLAMCIERTDMWEARDLYRIAAKAGLLDAIYNLGMLCMRLTPPDYNECRMMLLRAARRSHAGAIANLGVLYQEGRGVQRDVEKAIAYFERAAALGDPWAMGNLGCKHAHECTLAEKSLDWCREESAERLGIDWEMRLEQEGVDHGVMASPNFQTLPRKAIERTPGWLERCVVEAESALREAAHSTLQKGNLAALQQHLKKLEETAEHHRAAAIKWFTKASNAGHLDSMRNLGIMLGEDSAKIMQRSLTLTPSAFEETLQQSPHTIANITPSMGYRPSHSLARVPIDSSCLGLAQEGSSTIASPHHHHSKHNSEYWKDPKTPLHQYKHEGLLLHRVDAESSQNNCVPGSSPLPPPKQHLSSAGPHKLSLANSPPAAFFWGHRGDDAKSRRMSMQSRLLRLRPKLPMSMRNDGTGTQRHVRGAATQNAQNLRRASLSRASDVINQLKINEDDARHKRRTSAALLRELKSLLLERGLDATAAGVYDGFEKATILRDRLRVVMEKEKSAQRDRIRTRAHKMSGRLAKEKEKLGIRLSTRDVKELKESGQRAEPRQRIIYKI